MIPESQRLLLSVLLREIRLLSHSLKRLVVAGHVAERSDTFAGRRGYQHRYPGSYSLDLVMMEPILYQVKTLWLRYKK